MEEEESNFNNYTVEFQNAFDKISSDLLTNSGDYMKGHYESGKGPDLDSVEYARKEFERDIKDPLEELLKRSGERTYEEKQEIKQLEKNASTWRDENNQSLAFLRIAAEDIASDNIDKNQSFSKTDETTGRIVYDANKASLYTQVAHPGITLSSAGVRVERNDKGQRGYYYDPSVNRTLQNYQLLSGQEVTPSNKENMTFISEEELFSGIVKKDKDAVMGISDIQMEVLENFNNMEDDVMASDGQGGWNKTKSKVLKTESYKEISAKTEKDYLDFIMAPYSKNEDGSNKGKRNIKTGLTYMSNNEIEFGGKLINYNEMSKMNPNITSLTYAQLGLSGNSIDRNNDGLLTGDELSQEDFNIVHNKLMNPQTDEEVRISAKELARFFNLQTEDLANQKRSKSFKTKTTNQAQPEKTVEDYLKEIS